MKGLTTIPTATLIRADTLTRMKGFRKISMPIATWIPADTSEPTKTLKISIPIVTWTPVEAQESTWRARNQRTISNGSR
ncbi:MAG: hypothetical protein C4576_07475 [Desulfobacteraceae bacterium]|nr:MAG: hypothetical protein C4576_07475 [Desulfobacteraceae bacterium]